MREEAQEEVMDKFKAFIWKNKGYVIHAVAVSIFARAN